VRLTNHDLFPSGFTIPFHCNISFKVYKYCHNFNEMPFN
jgi:hypothetical protein